MNTDIIKVMPEDITISDSLSMEQKKPETPQDYLDLFCSEQDVKESSRKLYRRTLSLYFEWIKQEYPMLSFTDALNVLKIADVNRYKDSLQQKGMSKLTIGSYIVAVRKFYQWADMKRYYPNIARGIKTPPRKQEYRKEHIPEKQTSQILQYFKRDRKRQKTQKAKRPLSPESIARDYAIINLLLRTGLRTIEVVRADIGDITYRRDLRILKVWGKGRIDKEEDYVVLTDVTFAPIEEYISRYRKNAKPNEPLFPSLSTQNKGQRLTTRTISNLCIEGLKRVGLYDDSMKHRPYTPHSYRHTTAVSLIKAGADITEVQAVLRHSSIDTSKIYLRSIEEEMRLKDPAEKKLDTFF